MVDKRRARQGSIGGNWTPSEAKSILAIPVYGILTGRAVPVFPGSSVANPSGIVGIYRTPGQGAPLDPVGGFPVWVNGQQWERAVVPVLLDSRWRSLRSLLLSSVTENVRLIGETLALSFHQAGYGPIS